jgi:secondary thiamine-phosphate synthase enzyme
MSNKAYSSFKISTSSRSQFIDITSEVSDIVTKNKSESGVCKVFVPHTTAGVTINENADPDVIRDILMLLDEKVPWNHRSYRHGEGNSAAHIKASMMGSSVDVIINNGSLELGTWQSVFFCEFDGPRTRKVWVKIIEG